MSAALKLLLAYLAGFVSVGYVCYVAYLSPDNWIYEGGKQWKDGGYHGAPGPILGAGLPIVALAGAGYWAVRRRRSKRDAS